LRPHDVAVQHFDCRPRGSFRLARAALALAALSLFGASASTGSALADDVQPVGGSAGAAVASAEETLREGDRGPAVESLQRRLRLTADGVFGSKTKSAVMRFQRRRGLEVDGIVGPITRRALGLARFSSSSVKHSEPEGSGVRTPAKLRKIAQCESGGNPRAVSSNGRYRGKYQFSRATWKAMGGQGRDPAKASESHQDRVALKLFKARGSAPWPSCGSRFRARA
jgi:hypothetical protein